MSNNLSLHNSYKSYKKRQLEAKGIYATFYTELRRCLISTFQAGDTLQSFIPGTKLPVQDNINTGIKINETTSGANISFGFTIEDVIFRVEVNLTFDKEFIYCNYSLFKDDTEISKFNLYKLKLLSNNNFKSDEIYDFLLTVLNKLIHYNDSLFNRLRLTNSKMNYEVKTSALFEILKSIGRNKLEELESEKYTDNPNLLKYLLDRLTEGRLIIFSDGVYELTNEGYEYLYLINSRHVIYEIESNRQIKIDELSMGTFKAIATDIMLKWDKSLIL